MDNFRFNVEDLFPYYILLNSCTRRPILLKVSGITYFFSVGKQYSSYQTKDDFTLKEKLYILNLPLDVVWHPITGFSKYILTLFFQPISPGCLKIVINNGKVSIHIISDSKFERRSNDE